MKKLLTVLLALSMLLVGASAFAEWPERSIELIVPATPGGDTDANARALAAALNEELGWNVIVSNMSGGSGTVAYEDATINPDDGYRLVFYHSGAAITELMGLTSAFWMISSSPACRSWITPALSLSTPRMTSSPICRP